LVHSRQAIQSVVHRGEEGDTAIEITTDERQNDRFGSMENASSRRCYQFPHLNLEDKVLVQMGGGGTQEA